MNNSINRLLEKPLSSLYQELSTYLSRENQKIAAIGMLALACLATCYLIYRFSCFTKKASAIEDQPDKLVQKDKMKGKPQKAGEESKKQEPKAAETPKVRISDKKEAELARRLDEVENEKGTLTLQLEEVEKEKLTLTRELNQVKKDMLALKASNKILENSAKKILQPTSGDNKTAELARRLDEVEHEKVTLTLQLEEVENEKLTFTRELDQAKKDILALKASNKKLENEAKNVTKLISENATLKTEKQDLQVECNDVEKEKLTLTGQLDQAKRGIQALEASNKKLENEAKNVGKLISENATLKTEKQNLQDECNDVEKEKLTLTGQLDQAKRGIQALEASNKKLENEAKNVAKLISENATLKTEKQDLQDECNDKTGQIKKLKADHDHLIAKIKQLDSELIHLRTELQKVQAVRPVAPPMKWVFVSLKSEVSDMNNLIGSLSSVDGVPQIECLGVDEAKGRKFKLIQELDDKVTFAFFIGAVNARIETTKFNPHLADFDKTFGQNHTALCMIWSPGVTAHDMSNNEQFITAAPLRDSKGNMLYNRIVNIETESAGPNRKLKDPTAALKAIRQALATMQNPDMAKAAEEWNEKYRQK